MPIDYLALAKNQQRNEQLQLQERNLAMNQSRTRMLNQASQQEYDFRQKADPLSLAAAEEQNAHNLLNNSLMRSDLESQTRARQSQQEIQQAQEARAAEMGPLELEGRNLQNEGLRQDKVYKQQLGRQSEATTDQTRQSISARKQEMELSKKLAEQKEVLSYVNELNAAGQTLKSTTQEGSPQRMEGINRLASLFERSPNPAMREEFERMKVDGISDAEIDQLGLMARNLNQQAAEGQEFFDMETVVDPVTGEKRLYQPGKSGQGRFVENAAPPVSVQEKKYQNEQQKLAEKKQIKLFQAQENTKAYTRKALESIGIIDENPNLSGGILGSLTSFIPTMPANKLKDALSILVSQEFTTGVTDMREASPTGAAVGNTSDTEGMKLQQRMATFNPDAGVEQLRKDLIYVINRRQTQMKLLTGELPFVQTAQERSALSPGTQYYDGTSGKIRTASQKIVGNVSEATQ